MQPILYIDLTKQEIETITIPLDWQREYIGGSALAARMLYEHLEIDLDPLSPEAPLLFLNGPLTGTAGPAVGRFVICARSPATGLWGESNCGGFWGPELRKAGYDGLWVTGCARTPVFLQICDHQVEIKPADYLWGLETYQTQSILEEELTPMKYRIATIGPAGEKRVPFALILTDHGRVAGRTGMGAVMGSKLLKAVAVRGTKSVPIIKPDEFNKLRSQSNKELREDNLTRATRELGSSGGADYFAYLGEMPGKYYQSARIRGVDEISGTTMSETILTGVSACHACVIACGRVVRLDDGKKRKGPEYETIVGFGPNLLIDDLGRITIAGELCDRLGMDTISMSNTLGFAYTLFERGIISKSATFGLDLHWGDPDLVDQLVRMTAQREGFGSLLAEGALSLGRKFGVEDQAVQVNGLEVAYHDPRGASGMALVYATSPRGACHNQSDYFLVDILGHAEDQLGLKYFKRHEGLEKAANVARHQDWRTVCNALVLCFFANVEPDMIRKLVNEALGEDFSLGELLLIGERSWNLKRLINLRLGHTVENDMLPKIFLKPYSTGGSKGYQVPFQDMLTAYYQARKWDIQSGYPYKDKLMDLGLEWVGLNPE
ncbi:MAG: aldehyde ferredoxin oxidoreductase family protein [Anaerolineales bacterium]